jgi:parallel beta-helix repeat protein
VATIPLPQEEVIVPAGGDINDAIAVHPEGVRILIEGGVYQPVVMQPGVAFGTIVLERGDDELGVPTIIGEGNNAAITLIGQTNVIVDGLQLIGGDFAGVNVVDSESIDIRNCIIRGGRRGVVFERSGSSLVFDNLIYDNDLSGIRVLGSSMVRLINNTIYGHPASGIFIGSSPGDAVAIFSADVALQNNILEANTPFGIRAEEGSAAGYFAAYNLNRDGYDGVPVGFRDLSSNPLFIFPAGADFRVQVASGAGISPAIDRGDPNTDPALVAVLRGRTIRVDNFADGGVPDLGFHYPEGQDTPTPVPTTPTPGSGPVDPTPTPTATATP